MRDAPTTVAALSIFEDQIIGVISTSEIYKVLHSQIIETEADLLLITI